MRSVRPQMKAPSHSAIAVAVGVLIVVVQVGVALGVYKVLPD